MIQTLIPHPTLGVVYTCGLCGAIGRTVKVPSRGETEDIKAWMNNVVIPALVRDHQHVSPMCRPASFRDVKIPVPQGENARIGDPPVEH